MPSKKYAIEVGGAKRLEVAWGFRWNDFVVRYDGHEVGRLDGGHDAVRRGAKFELPGGSTLRVQLVRERGGLGYTEQLHLFLDGKPVHGSAAVPIPGWGYAFVAACAVIPIVTLGGAIPAAIGLGAAAVCANLARDTSRSASKRAMTCAGVTALAWIAFGVFASLVASAHE